MWADLLFTCRVVAAAVVLQVLLPVMKLPRLVAAIESRRAGTPPQAGAVQRTIRLVTRVARFPYFLIRNNCLKKSLLLYYFLVRTGVTGVRIHIGVNKENGAVAGHSWLTLDGKLLNETEEFVARYAVIYSSGV